MTKVVVRVGYNAPELGVVISERPKTLLVAPLYGMSLRDRIADAPNRTTGERWNRDSCVLLDPSIPSDMAKIVIAEGLIREHQVLNGQIRQMQEEYRTAYKARVAEVFGQGVA